MTLGGASAAYAFAWRKYTPMKLPYIVAEVGLNHGGSLLMAAKMIERAAAAGANACKFQFVKADRLVSRSAPVYFQQTAETVATQHSFFRRSDDLNRADYEQLAGYCHDHGVDFLCTPFDVETVEWLNPLVPAFKIASADITNIPLLEAVGRTRKPVYLSTGAATEQEMATAWRAAWGAGVDGDRSEVIFLHCVLSYPTSPSDANLGIIRDWCDGNIHEGRGERYGYSDHTLFNLDVLTTAWLLGATVIEKHFTLDKTLPGNDHYHSMDPTDLRALVAKFKELQAMIGDGEKRVLPCEEAARLNARQSWHAARDLPVGFQIMPGDVVLKRPGTGLPPSHSPVNRVLIRSLVADEPITADDIELDKVLIA